MKKLVICLILAGCSTMAEPVPSVSDLGIKTNSAGLVELATKVSGRDDADCTTKKKWLICSVRDGAEVYTFATSDHAAHPAALFQGYVDSDDGVRLEERGWYSGDKDLADSFFKSAKKYSVKPVQ